SPHLLPFPPGPPLKPDSTKALTLSHPSFNFTPYTRDRRLAQGLGGPPYSTRCGRSFTVRHIRPGGQAFGSTRMRPGSQGLGTLRLSRRPRTHIGPPSCPEPPPSPCGRLKSWPWASRLLGSPISLTPTLQRKSTRPF